MKSNTAVIVEQDITAEKNLQRYYEGIEIGAVSIKFVQRTDDGITSIGSVRHEGNPLQKLQEIFSIYSRETSRVTVTGQSAKELLNFQYRSITECIEKALQYFDIRPDILLSLGGENFTVYTLKNGEIQNIIPTSKCAAGTGEFFIQQLQRMDLSLEDGIRISSNGRLVQLATRCSVYCKSDATHKLNKGECTSADITKTLINDLAKKVCKMIDSSKWTQEKIIVSGGVSLNIPFIEVLRNQLDKSEIIVLDESPCLEAFGASLFSGESGNYISPGQTDRFKNYNISFETLASLQKAEDNLDYRVNLLERNKIIPGGTYILGVDAGSTTTKAVLFNIDDGSLGASCYLRTHGNPVLATKECLHKLIEQVGASNVNIVQAAVTGSGRELVSVFLDNCITFNEILAHARAASEEVSSVDTVFEIGGQDSKFISFLQGVPIDYAMNEGCSAGTGSFLEESVSVDMGITFDKISNIAIDAGNPISFGERCAAFINTDLRNALRQGAKQEDVIAGLVYSIAKNYISRIVGMRRIGDTLLFQGGVALNKAVALAMASLTGKKVVVPALPELMGCVGCGLMIKDLLQINKIPQKNYFLNELVTGAMEEKGTFICKACDNRCEIRSILLKGQVHPFGGLCSKYELTRHKKEKAKEGKDYIEIRNKMLFEEFGPRPVDKPRGTVGIPLALSSFEFYPLYAKLFNNLGYNVVTSNPSKIGNSKTRGEFCYPGEIAHGHVYDLLNRNVDFIFLPGLIDCESNKKYLKSYVCPTTSMMPDILIKVFKDLPDKILSPHLSFSDGNLESTIEEIGEMSDKLGLKRKAVMKAGKIAYNHYKEFKKKYYGYGKAILEEIKDEPTIIIAGKPYITCSSEVNLALPKKITSRGYNVIQCDMLPEINFQADPRNAWTFTQQVMNAIAFSKKNKNFNITIISCFSCITDGIMYNRFREQLTGQVFCYLEIDSHTAHAGFETRVGAFLDIIEERKRKGII